MKIQEYIRSVIKPIRSKTRSRQIAAELKDHIIVNQEFFEEIGYDTDTAQEKAVECMGDAEPIGEQFEHMDYRWKRAAVVLIANIIIPIICYIIINRTYDCENIIGTLSSLIAFCITVALSSVMSVVNLKTRHISGSILNSLSTLFVCTMGAMNCVFNAFDRSAVALFNYLFLDKTTDSIYTYDQYGTERYDFLFILLILLPIFLSSIFTIIYKIRIAHMKNRKADIKVRKIMTVLCTVYAILFIVLTITGISKTNTEEKNIETDYQRAVSAAIEIIGADDEECEDLLKKYNFKEGTDDWLDPDMMNSGNTFRSAKIKYDDCGQIEIENANVISRYNPYSGDEKYIKTLVKADEDKFEYMESIKYDDYKDKNKDDILKEFVDYNPFDFSAGKGYELDESGYNYTDTYSYDYYFKYSFENDNYIYAYLCFDQNDKLTSLEIKKDNYSIYESEILDISAAEEFG